MILFVVKQLIKSNGVDMTFQRTLFSAFLVGAVGLVAAQTTYQRIGSTTYSSYGQTYQQIGSTTYGSDGSTYNRIGNTTYSNDGTSYQRQGNTTYGSDGSTAQRIGNFTTITAPGAVSATCQKIGIQTFCN
jgi:hypothetical protein